MIDALAPYRPAETAASLHGIGARLHQLFLEDCAAILDIGLVEMKIHLARRLHFTMQMYDQLSRRAAELGDDQAPDCAGARPGAPPASPRAYLVASADTIRQLERACESAVARLHPLWDEPSSLVLKDVVARLSLEAQLSDALLANADLQALLDGSIDRVGEGGAPAQDARFVPARDARFVPARDARFVIVEKSAARNKAPVAENFDRRIDMIHLTIMGTEIPTIEACCDLILGFGGEMPRAFSRDMARQCWDEARHAQSLIDRLTSLGGRLGYLPVDHSLWALCRDQPLALRLAMHQKIGERIGIDAALGYETDLQHVDEDTARLFAFIAQDEILHVSYGNKWIAYLAADEAAVEAITVQAEQRRNAFGHLLLSPAFPLALQTYRRAGLSDRDVARLARLRPEPGCS